MSNCVISENEKLKIKLKNYKTFIKMIKFMILNYMNKKIIYLQKEETKWKK
jgi:hypothetical protein